MTNPDTSAQDAPVASQEAEARKDVYRAFAAHMKVVGPVDPPIAENVPDALDAYAATIRASERERYTALVEAAIWMSGADDFASGKPAYTHWIEIRDGVLASVLAALEEAGSV